MALIVRMIRQIVMNWRTVKTTVLTALFLFSSVLASGQVKVKSQSGDDDLIARGKYIVE
jgi:hypothetical protein